jgi:hypothetical protein
MFSGVASGVGRDQPAPVDWRVRDLCGPLTVRPERAFLSLPLMENAPASPSPRAEGRVHRGSLGFFALCVLVVLAVGLSVYVELKIRAAAAEIERLAGRPGRPAAPVARAANQAPVAVAPAPPGEGWTERGRWKWVSDFALMERQARQAAAAIGYDRGLVRGAENQIKVRLRFHELYRILGLSAAEIAAFEREAADRSLTFTGLVTSDPEQEEDHKRSQAIAMERIIERTLGRDYVEPFRLFLATSDLRDLTAELAVHSLGAGEPLAPAQAAALLQATLELRRSREGVTRIDPAQVDWAAVAARAQQFLTPAQHSLLRAMIDRRLFDQTYRDITGLTLRRPTRGL